MCWVNENKADGCLLLCCVDMYRGSTHPRLTLGAAQQGLRMAPSTDTEGKAAVVSSTLSSSTDEETRGQRDAQPVDAHL